jgi:predicted dehydrogenase
MDRRSFLAESSAVAAGATFAGAAISRAQDAAGANDRVGVAVMGLRGRGGHLLRTFAEREDVAVLYVCDIDSRVLQERAAAIEQQTGRKPKAVKDFREALDDKAVDALVNGGPDHWHAIPAILACQAGKDVYVEKPDGHNVLEGRAMVAAMRKHGRVVQLGTQARSNAHAQSAMRYIAEGNLGKVRFAKAWESARQGSIGHTPDSEPPPGVDYDLWLGPAPKRPFNSRRFHGSWRWFFDYGTGDLGNDGVHRLDLARWGLAAALKAEGRELPAAPRRVSAHGGKHYFDDDQEWPDTQMVTYDFPGCVMTYELRIWSPYKLHEEHEGAAVLGDNGFVVLGNRRWRAFEAKGNLVSEESGPDNTTGHVENFVECIRSREKPAADLETVGHPSSLLCHLGNAAWRLGRTLQFDPETYTCGDDAEANRLLTRPSYREPWVLPEV